MKKTAHKKTQDSGGEGFALGIWPALPPDVGAAYENHHGAERNVELFRSIIIGLVFYNCFNLSSIVLLPDLLTASVILRCAFITPASLLITYLISRVSPLWRERMVLFGVIQAFMLPAGLFAVTSSDLSPFFFSELPLIVIFGNMFMMLRFRHAVAFTAVAIAIASIALALRPDIMLPLRLSLMLQFTTGAAFSLCANHIVEMRRCRDFLATYRAEARARSAEAERQTLLDLSLTDPLTGLPNRRCLDRQMAAWRTNSNQLVAIMIDLDYFKPFNDTLGHRAGDDCLVQVAAVLSSEASHADRLCARYGGEEFVLFAEPATVCAGALLAERILKRIEALRIAHPSRPDGKTIITASLGVATGRKSEAETVLNAADQALYEAKRSGRAQLVSAREQLGPHRLKMAAAC